MKFHWIMSFINFHQFNWHGKTSSYWYIFISSLINTHIFVIFSSKRRLFNAFEFFKLNDECSVKYFIFNRMMNFFSHLGIPILLLISTKVIVHPNYEFSSQWSILSQIQIFITELNYHWDKFTPDRWSLITIMNCIIMMNFRSDEFSSK